MNSARKILGQRNDAKSKLELLFKQPSTVIVIHYSCESFRNLNDGSSPRITSIAVRNLDNGQTQSFSLHYEAERDKINFHKIEQKADYLEKRMLCAFYQFVQSRPNHKWLHWNMRDINYGFDAIAHRYRILEGEPTDIPEAQRYDLARILPAIYGSEYAEHPRMKNIIEMNQMTNQDFLDGEQEAEAFKNGEYVRLHQSTLRKTDVFSNIAEKAWLKNLKTKTKWWKHYGLGVRARAYIEIVYEHWVFQILMILSVMFTIYSFLRLLGIF